MNILIEFTTYAACIIMAASSLITNYYILNYETFDSFIERERNEIAT